MTQSVHKQRSWKKRVCWLIFYWAIEKLKLPVTLFLAPPLIFVSKVSALFLFGGHDHVWHRSASSFGNRVDIQNCFKWQWMMMILEVRRETERERGGRKKREILFSNKHGSGDLLVSSIQYSSVVVTDWEVFIPYYSGTYVRMYSRLLLPSTWSTCMHAYCNRVLHG